MISICAIIAVHNGEKTLDRVLEHFARNSIDVQILDHGSSDRTPRIIEDRMRRPIIGHSRIEFDGIFRMRELLQHKEQIVRSLAHDWVIHADADEIMESPLNGETLRGMIERQDRDGFDIIDCDEFVFVPRQDHEPADFVGEMKSYYFFSPTGRTLHRVQRVRGASLDWSTTGGHQLSTSVRCVATEKIRLRHYIGLTFDHLKSQYLGRVFDGSELAKGWHRNRVPMTQDFIVKPDPTRLFDIENDGWKTDQPEQKHLLFQQPHRYEPPALLPKSIEREPFPFVVGVGRSGTTLLRLMIDAHPDIAITPETHWLRPTLRHLSERADDVEGIRRRILGEPSWRDMGISDQELEEVLSTHDHQDPSETIRKIYARYGLRHGVARVGDKTPLHGLAMHDIASFLPEAHFIHIIRDGRDVATSYRDLWFGPGKDPKAAAVFWMWRIRETRQQARFVPNYLEVRYEALVTNPEKVLREIGDFIGLPFDKRQLMAHQTAEDKLKELQDVVRSHRTIPAEERRSIHRLTWKEPDPTRVGRWRVAMSADEVAGFERVAGEMLSDMGYPRAEP